LTLTNYHFDENNPLFQHPLIVLSRSIRHAVIRRHERKPAPLHHLTIIEGNSMKVLTRLVALLAILWLALLLTGYGILTSSSQNVAGMGLQCQYLTARGMVVAQYLHTDSGIIGVADCPLLRKSSKVIDN